MLQPGETLRVPMRDGVTLAADLYQPAEERRRPVIVIRTPYGKQGWRNERFLSLALDRDYAVAVFDVRGRYESDGDFDAYRHEGRDGYDAIEWVAAQPWSTGRIATAGLSYPGAVQWLAAVEAPPHLVCAFPAMCFSSGRQFFYFGGAFDMSWLPWTVENIAPSDRRRRGVTQGPQTVREARAWWKDRGREALARVPLRDQPALQGVAPFYFDWLDHPDDGPYWDFANMEKRYGQVRVPIFNFSGWHDEGYGPIGATHNFAGLRAYGATPDAKRTRLTIGPWIHGEPGTGRVGDRDFGNVAAIDYEALVLDWCDLHVHGIDRSGLGTAAPVGLFLMGANRWIDAPAWPLPARATAWHLRAGGRLTLDPSGPGEPADAYTFDPNDPVVDPHYDVGLGPHDQRAIEQRRDVLAFTSDPLPDDLDVIGPLEFRLWIASSAPDTDFYCRLLDVQPDGTAWNLMSPTLEVLRARYRHGEEEPVFLTPGQPVQLTFRHGLTANRFLKGHRIRVQVTSSFFPHLDRNPNTGRPSAIESRLVPARQTIFHDAARPSRVILPIARRE
jgi:putative CocE/NonD family hydrolase